MPDRLVLIDRDSGFVQVLANRLERAGWEHRPLDAAPPVRALVALEARAVVVDPDHAGAEPWAWLQHVRAQLPEIGLVVCTAPSTLAQRVRALRLGVDDWVTKPCHPEEVVARVEAVVRGRREPREDAAAPALTAGELKIHADRFQVLAGGRPLQLTRRQFELLAMLAAAEGQVLEREDIYQRVWG